MNEILGCIFDLDGTLLDSMGVWEQIDWDFLGSRGLSVPEDYVQAVTPMGFRASAEYTIQRFQLPDTPEQLMEEWTRMAQDAYHFRIELKPGAKEYLSFLKEHGVRLAVATSSYEALFLPALERTGIAQWFDAIVTVSQVERGKGFPDIYLEAAKRIQCSPEECMVFEDILEGVKGAKDGGFFTVGVYDSFCRSEKEQLMQWCDLYIENFGRLLPPVPSVK